MSAAIWTASARWLLCAALTLIQTGTPALAGADERKPANATARSWDARPRGEATAWPHSEQDARIVPTAAGLRVEVATGRRFAIAAASGRLLPKDLGRIRVSVAQGGGAQWFVRLYGELRRPGDRRAIGIAQDETAAAERVFSLDPRLRQLNAELGRRYDVDRLLNWCFDVSDTRGGWAVTVGNWGGYDCDALLGSIDNRCGYAFAMNTFVQAGALVPLNAISICMVTRHTTLFEYGFFVVPSASARSAVAAACGPCAGAILAFVSGWYASGALVARGRFFR